jgi:hypothetical protein
MKVQITITNSQGHSTLHKMAVPPTASQFALLLVKFFMRHNLFSRLHMRDKIVMVKEDKRSALAYANPFDNPDIIKKCTADGLEAIDIAILHSLFRKNTVEETGDAVGLTRDGVNKRLANMYLIYLDRKDRESDCKKKYKLVIEKIIAGV